MAVDTSRFGPSPSVDSYIGSLISLTSRCEIRYEGILYNISTEESSIGLRNVRSFGTEGRKKDGQQIPPSDKIYEYILFRGSDIKDLQVKSSLPIPTAPHVLVHNDPAIIQSQYSRPASTSSSSPSVGSETIADLGSHTAQLGMPRSTFQGGLPLYQPGGTLGSWGSSPPPPPTANGSGLAMPIYWQGFYAPSGGLSHIQQQPLLRPPPGLPMPQPGLPMPTPGLPMPPPGLPMPQSLQQALQYRGIHASPSGSTNLPVPNSSLPSGSSHLRGANALLPSGSTNFPAANGALRSGPSNLPGSNASLPSVLPNLPDYPGPLLPAVSSTLPSTFAPIQASSSTPEISPSLMPTKPHISSQPMTTLRGNLPFASPSISSLESTVLPVSSKPRSVLVPNFAYQTVSQAVSSISGSSGSGQAGISVPSLVTPGQLLQPGPATISSSQPLQTRQNKPGLSEPPKLAPAEAREPILPLPTPPDRKPNGATFQSHHNSMTRGRGRGTGYPRPVIKFTEDFDFIAMNEKFKKDEVWGHLGKSKSQFKDKEGDLSVDNDDDLEEGEKESSKVDSKPVYVKDDFFDSLSCNALDRGTHNGRTKFSEQRKIDTETFGDFPRHRPSRGGGRGFRGGQTRGSYHGRGYGYVARGRGQSVVYRAI